ncbi:MAG: hypothetical protein ABI042_15605 [Verrucomicrobiota bacterium]
MNERFTINGSNALEDHLRQSCEKIAQAVLEIIPREKIEALLLGGGYGRGQGGVLKTNSGDQPYNDLEFYLCLRGSTLLNQKNYGGALHHLGERLSPTAGLEVEFKITSLKKILQIPPTMFSYDLAWGHRSLIGATEFFSTQPDARKIPLSEATRLLMNRCTGLLFAREHLQRKPFTPDDADFVGRNHAKAQLGFGDAFLTANGQYHWDVRERNKRLATLKENISLPWLDEIRQQHNAGVEFKFHPYRSTESLERLCEKQLELTTLGLKVWLWIEGHRLTKSFPSASDYALSDLSKCPETNALRNFLINARRFGGKMISQPITYPRQRLFHSLALLLWEPETFTDPKLLRRVQNELQTSATTFRELVLAYETLWKNYN